jgi:hypothetical protein
LIPSWQWMIYMYATDARIFMYRGYSWTYKTTEELILQGLPSLREEVRDYLGGVYAARQALVDAELVVWPRRKPDSCGAFGRPCPYLQDCEDYTMPQVAPGDRQLSYSSAANFLLCPERHRRDCLSDEKGETKETIMGQAFHRGMEEMYRQGAELVG